MKPDDFNSNAAGELVRASGPTGEHWAFIPHPLPPELLIDRELLVVISDADRALGELAGVGRHMANPKLFIRPFIRREAVLSSRIEGTKAELSDVYAYESGHEEITADVDDVREVANYVTAMGHGIRALNDRSLTSGLLRELHRVLLTKVRGEKDRPGEFRDCPVFIGSESLDKARFVPPPVVRLRDLLDDFDRYLHRPHDYPPIVRLALLHYQFEAIHPFRDGNGRIGRLLITLLLVHWNLLPQPLLYLSAYFESRRRDYYDRLLAVSTHGDWQNWIHFFALGVAEQSRDAASRAKKLQDLQKSWREKVQAGSHVSVGLLKMVDRLFQYPYADVSELERRLKVSKPTALSILRKLTQLGFITEITGRARNQVFRADPILNVLK